MDTRKIKLIHPDAQIPTKKHSQDAGYDCFLIEDLVLKPKSHLRFNMGFAIEIKDGEMLTVRSRSSTKMKGVSCAETTCDPGYTGELYGFLINHSDEEITFTKGSRVVQLVFLKIQNNQELVEGQLTTSERGQRGFGSTGT